MAIKNFGTGTPKFNEGIIVSGSNPQLYVSGNININSPIEPTIQFQIGGSDTAKILVNTSNNLVFHNQYTNKHIVFKTNDAGTTREALRLDGAVPEVVVNQSAESLIDFRVESNNNTHMLFVDGGNEKVGIGTSQPATTFHAYANVSNAYVATIDNDQSSAGHVLKLLTDGNGSGSRLLEMEDGDGDVIFRARADGRFGFGPDGVSSMGAGTFVVGIDNSSHTADIAISQRLQHLGDANTYLDFPSADTFNLVAGGNSFLKYDDGVILINNANANVDTRIMADNGAVVLHVDAGTNCVGVGTGSPTSTLSVAGSIALNVLYFGQSNDPGTTYSMSTTDCVILANTRPTAQGGIDSAITITLPDASDFPGRVVIIKDAAGYCDVNAITITVTAGDNIDGNPSTTTMDLPTPASFKKLISDGVNSWYEIGS